MNQIAVVGVDLAKAVIMVFAADREGSLLFYKQLSFNGFAQWAATIPPCTFGMEACGSAHHWGRRLRTYGHTVRLMAAEFVKPFRKSQGAKNDRNDAQAVLTAVRQPDMRIVGVGPMTASAVAATVTNASDFKNGRQMAAWLGLVPKQFSSGGKTSLGKITRRGDTYLRGLLTGGARSALISAMRRPPEKRTRLQHWMIDARLRLGFFRTLVAIANKHARIIWAILAKGEAYDPDAWKRYMPQSA